MSMLLAVIAFLMAFGALWFTSEVARRLDTNGQGDPKSQLAPMRESLRRAERQIRELTRGLDEAERKLRALDTPQPGQHSRSIDDSSSIAGANRPLSTLDILRDTQRFYPSETYNA